MTNTIGALFGRSPIRPLEGHMAKATACVDLLNKVIEATARGDSKQADASYQELLEAQADADEIRRDIRTHLPKSLLLPAPRTDLLELLRVQDDIVFRCKETAKALQIRKREVPESIRQSLEDYCQSTAALSHHAQKAVNELDELVETGFKGKEADFVSNLISQMDELAAANEAAQIEFLSRIHEHEDSLAAIDTMLLYKLADSVASICHLVRKVGSRLLVLIAH